MRFEARKGSVTFVVSAELGIIAGIILAFYFVPENLPAHTFWSVAAVFFVITNGYLFISPKKEN